MLADLYKQVAHSFRWNSIESICYQFLLLAHQLMLFKVTPYASYGLIGSLFSGTYLLVMLINFGFDASLSPFFKELTLSKQQFKRTLAIQVVPEYILLSILALTVFAFNKLIFGIADGFLLGMLGIIVLCESAKKTLRMILQLAFFNQKTALIEIASIIVYTGLVWTGYALGYPITTSLIFIPMLIMSVSSCIALSIVAYSYYRSLPEATDPVSSALQWKMLKNRFFNFLNQASHSIFSSNFLVPCFALIFGLQQAGILKVVSSITHCVTIVVQKVFGISSNIMLSHLRHADTATKQHAFSFITDRLHHILYGLCIFSAINCATLLRLGSFPTHGHVSMLVYLYLIISFSESFFIAYEKLYINQEKASSLFIFNVITMGLLALTIYHAAALSPLTLMLAIIAIRFIAFLAMSIASAYLFSIKPTFNVRPNYLIWSFAFSLIFFIVAQKLC